MLTNPLLFFLFDFFFFLFLSLIPSKMGGKPLPPPSLHLPRTFFGLRSPLPCRSRQIPSHTIRHQIYSLHKRYNHRASAPQLARPPTTSSTTPIYSFHLRFLQSILCQSSRELPHSRDHEHAHDPKGHCSKLSLSNFSSEVKPDMESWDGVKGTCLAYRLFRALALC